MASLGVRGFETFGSAASRWYASGVTTYLSRWTGRLSLPDELEELDELDELEELDDSCR